MLNEIIKTAEELNTAALHYRQSGNMDGVRELAKAYAVSQKQTEKFIQGSGWLIYRLRKESLRMRLKNCVQKCLP